MPEKTRLRTVRKCSAKTGGRSSRFATIAFVNVRLSWEGKERAMALAGAKPPSRIFQGEKGRLLHGDNRGAMASLLPELRGKVTLAYMDPPFLTARAHDVIVKDK